MDRPDFGRAVVSPDGEAQPPAGPPLTAVSGRREDEGVGPDDALPGVLGRRQALRQPAPPGQHDHGQRQDQHHGQYRARARFRTRARRPAAEQSGASSRTFRWASITSRGERGELGRRRRRHRQPLHLPSSPSPPRSKSQRRRFEEELNERMIRTIDGINSQK